MTSKDENENISDRVALETEITALITEINELKHVMFEVYKKNKSNVVFKEYNASTKGNNSNKSICITSKSKRKRKITHKEKMTSQFYKRFLKVFCRSRLDAVRFSFPNFGKEQYGLQFRCMAIGTYYLEKCYLPHTFNMKDQKQNSHPVTYNEIPKYIHIVMENINAYSLREKQVDDLKRVLDKRVLISHSTCYTDIDLNFKILTSDSSARKCVHVNLFYPLLNILPTGVEVTVDGDMLLKRYLEAIFAVFKEETLSKAYQQAFVSSDQLKFFI